MQDVRPNGAELRDAGDALEKSDQIPTDADDHVELLPDHLHDKLNFALTQSRETRT